MKMKILMLLIQNAHFSALNADCCLVTKLCPTLWNPMDCNRPGFPALHHLLEFAQTHVHCFSDAANHLILCRPLLLLPSVFPSIRVFSNVSALLIRWQKYWSFSFSISPSNEYSGLISYRIDWFDLLAVQELSRVFSSTTLQKHQFFSTQPSLWSSSHICTWCWKSHSFDCMDLCWQSDVSAF